MRQKINLEELFLIKKDGAYEMAFKTGSFNKNNFYEESRWTSANCLMNLKTVNDRFDIFIKIPVDNMIVHKDFKTNESFVQWWLDFIKDAICPLYNSVIYNKETTKKEIVILIPKRTDRSTLVGFTNYELIRYLCGVKFNKIPNIVYELIKHRRKYFETDIELFYYALYIFDVVNAKNNFEFGNTNPNYTWHFSATVEVMLNMQHGFFNIPLNFKPKDYIKFVNNFDYLRSTNKELSAKLSEFTNSVSTSRNISNMYSMKYEDRVKEIRKFKQKLYDKYITSVKTNINNIYSFKSSLNVFRKLSNLKHITIKNEIATA